MDDKDRLIGFLFSDISRFRGILFDRMMQPHGLTLAQSFLLNHLFRQDGLTQIRLAALMDIGTVTISGLVDRLEARGLVERRVDKADRRAKRVWLTPRAEEIRVEMARTLSALNDVTLAGMSEGEIVQLAALLRVAKKNLLGAIAEEKKQE